WDIIPRDLLLQICQHLYNANDGRDLANLARMSHHYSNVVMNFMSGPNTRPGIEKVNFYVNNCELTVAISLFSFNLPLYGLENLDRTLFERTTSYECSHVLRVTL
ncbi:hypothetical protein PMAYCL1PPCAC_25591, partial [Pristionchus mayeri]